MRIGYAYRLCRIGYALNHQYDDRKPDPLKTQRLLSQYSDITRNEIYYNPKGPFSELKKSEKKSDAVEFYKQKTC